jgi:tetratricopeptide (TPR) repeat protein
LIDEELYDKAMDVTNMALESDSLNLFFLHKKGVIYFGMDEYDDSIKTFQIVLNNSVDEINLLEDCLFFIAESNFLLGNYETSIRSFTELIKVMLHDKELLLKEKIYQNTSEFFKSLLYNYTRLIIIIDKLEEYRKLRETLETIISIIQDNNIETIIDYPIIIVYYLVPINDYKLNESDTAILNYRKAVQLDTEYKGDLDKLAEVWFLEDNIDILREIAKMADK